MATAEELITRFSVDDAYTAVVKKMTATTKDLHNAMAPGTGQGFDGFVSGMKLAVAELDSATPVLQEVVSILKTLAIAGGAAGAAILAFGIYAMHSAADLEALRLGLAAYASTSEQYEKNLRRLREIARLPGLGFAEAIQGSTRLQAAGLDARLAERAMLGFGNALAAVGGGKAELDGVILALTQIASKSQVSAEEINQIAERVPQIRRLMLEMFGTANTEQLAKLGIGPQQFIFKIIDGLETLQKANAGAKNSFENFGDVVMRVVAQIGDVLNAKFLPSLDKVVGFFDFLEENQIFGGIATGITDLLGDMDKFEDVILRISALVVASLEQIPQFVKLIEQVISENVKQISDLFRGIIDLINQLIQSYVDFTHGNLAALLGITPQKGFKIKIPEFKFGDADQDAWDKLFGNIGDRAKELLWGFKHWKQSDEVANDPSKGGFTFSAQENLSQIAKATKRTAENTDAIKQLTRMVFGGGTIGKMGVTPVELALGIPRGRRTGRRAIEDAIRFFTAAVYEEGHNAALDTLISRQRAFAR